MAVLFRGNNVSVLQAFDFCWEHFGDTWRTRRIDSAYAVCSMTSEEWKRRIGPQQREMLMGDDSPTTFFAMMDFDKPDDEMLFKLTWC